MVWGMGTFYKAILALTVAIFATVVLTVVCRGPAYAGPYVLTFFLLLAIGCRAFTKTKSFTYTIVIFGAATMALYYPGPFISYGSFKYARLIIPLIQLIMFGMGTSMHYKDFIGVLSAPRGILIGVASHFIIMPLLGFSIATLSIKFAAMPPRGSCGHHTHWLLPQRYGIKRSIVPGKGKPGAFCYNYQHLHAAFANRNPFFDGYAGRATHQNKSLANGCGHL